MPSLETPPAQDPVLASLERLHARLDRMEARIDAVVHAAPGTIAAVVDTFDDVADRLGDGTFDARMRAGTRVLEQVTRPDTLRVLEQLLGRMDRVEALVTLSDQLPGSIAMVVDTLDDIADRVGETGVPVHVRVTNLVALAERLTSPGMVELVDTLDARLPALQRVLQSALLDDASAEAAIVAGIQLHWKKVDGLEGNLGTNGIVSNYRADLAPKTWDALQSFRGGNAVFTFPPVPIKCAGAPQKIMYLADETLRKEGVREKSNIVFMSASAGIFGVPKYAAALRPIVARKGIDARFRQNLVAVRAAAKEAVFRHLDTGEETVLNYELLHVVPPQSAPDFLKTSPLADAAGWVDVDKYTLQHTRYPNVFSLGDASSLPTSRTGAAIRKQAPVLVENLLSFRQGDPLLATYDGYTSCPLVTGYGKLILAEFDYDGNPRESFPFDQARERASMYALKAYVLPEMYWNGMLRGRA